MDGTRHTEAQLRFLKRENYRTPSLAELTHIEWIKYSCSIGADIPPGEIGLALQKIQKYLISAKYIYLGSAWHHYLQKSQTMHPNAF